MSSTAASPTLSRPTVLADLADLVPALRRSALARDAVLVVGGAALVGVAAQVSVPLGFTPVPLTLQTLAVLLTGAALGGRRAAVSMIVYAVAGLAGVPWFAGHSGGWASATAAAFGYVVAFVVAAAVVGALAEHRGDRTPLRTAASMVIGTAVIYAVGATWLALNLHVGPGTALHLGVVPFLIGDAIKVVVAAALLPATWRLVSRSGR